MATTSTTSTLTVFPNDGTDTPSCVTSDATAPVPESACRRLLRRAFSPDGFPPLINSICSSKVELDEIRSLPSDVAQTFIDAIEESLHKPELPLPTRKQCLKLLYRTCGHHALLPKDLHISAVYDKNSGALYKGTYGDVWKGEYNSKNVAVKVIRTYSKDDLRRVMHRFCREVVTWRFLKHPNIVPMIGVMMSENHFAMVSDWMENGSIVEFLLERPEVDRIPLLIGAVEGLIYLHKSGMIHGDLKGANILVDKDGNARLVDFGLLTVMSDPANRLPSSSNNQAGTVRWMSPELLFPDQFELEKSRPTKESDCYALGMVIYEAIRGEVPFFELMDLAVFGKLVTKEHPTRGDEFPNDLWEMLERCWAFQPTERPSIEDVLARLQSTPAQYGVPPPRVDGGHRPLVCPDEDDGSMTLRSNTLQSSGTVPCLDNMTMTRTLEALQGKLEALVLEPEPMTEADVGVGAGPIGVR